MAPSAQPPPADRKRVKVYELKNGDWFDRGTGFCTSAMVNDEPRIYVQSEDDPQRVLLETRVTKDDGYQKQQGDIDAETCADTLIVWTEQNGTDMALSFQEADGCGAIWDFVSEVQSRLAALSGADDGLSDDVMDMHPIMLPDPELGNLADIETMIRAASAAPTGRDALARFVMSAGYIPKLVPLVEIAEDLESLEDLHRLCNIMKTLILLNDSAIIEHAVADEVIMGVVGALEYDPDFPTHKANHRQYLADKSRYKEVVKIEDVGTKRKIHCTYRLQYLKDVVLARILDDPTFSVLNSLIFFHQVDVVTHLQANAAFLKELFGIFRAEETDMQRKKDAVLLIQQCCTIAKSLQGNSRAQLYSNFLGGGLLNVITFALRNSDAAVRVAGTDILVALIDHDAIMVRSQIFKAINEKTKPLTDTLIELLLVETDLGVKAQMADAIKVLLDPNANHATMETLGRANSEFLAKTRHPAHPISGTDTFIQNFYDESAKKLFQPLKDLQGRESMDNLSIPQVSLYSHLVEVLCFFIRQHSFRSKYFILSEDLASRVAQLMACPEKHLKLTALKYFRTCIGLHDEFHNRQIIQNRLFEPILNIVFETMPRDNLLNSACLELFEFVKRETIKPIIDHLVENYREKLEGITYVPTFQSLILRYEQLNERPEPTAPNSFVTDDSDSGRHPTINGSRLQGLRDMDAEEEAYFNGSDDEDDTALPSVDLDVKPNGAVRPLVDYPEEDDDDEDAMDVLQDENAPALSTELAGEERAGSTPSTGAPPTPPTSTSPQASPPRQQTPVPSTPPPERLSEKRRREEDDEDELGKLSQQTKRRSSSMSSVGSNLGVSGGGGGRPKRKGSAGQAGKDGGGGGGGPGKGIAIKLPLKANTKGESGGNE
ncbi:component of IIS longevity pathway SMK-1-domain-containing protein [Phyllosticta citribraziliensis]|uniref:Component of IIS longevity pathway SMK-1-domain-containing protein n=1 Tax=Phyllosticta citribraziliensis TaxID=989973 RepID=A0ABR1L8W6_9PEZI